MLIESFDPKSMFLVYPMSTVFAIFLFRFFEDILSLQFFRGTLQKNVIGKWFNLTATKHIF